MTSYPFFIVFFFRVSHFSQLSCGLLPGLAFLSWVASGSRKRWGSWFLCNFHRIFILELYGDKTLFILCVYIAYKMHTTSTTSVNRSHGTIADHADLAFFAAQLCQAAADFTATPATPERNLQECRSSSWNVETNLYSTYITHTYCMYK